jgi:hypothetical protein
VRESLDELNVQVLGYILSIFKGKKLLVRQSMLDPKVNQGFHVHPHGLRVTNVEYKLLRHVEYWISLMDIAGCLGVL